MLFSIHPLFLYNSGLPRTIECSQIRRFCSSQTISDIRHWPSTHSRSYSKKNFCQIFVNLIVSAWSSFSVFCKYYHGICIIVLYDIRDAKSIEIGFPSSGGLGWSKKGRSANTMEALLVQWHVFLKFTFLKNYLILWPGTYFSEFCPGDIFYFGVRGFFPRSL